MNTRSWLPLVLLFAACSPGPALRPTAASPQGAPDSAAIMATLQRLVDGMRDHDSALMRSAFHPDARLFGMRRRPNGTEVTQVLTADQFAAAVHNDSRADWIERLFDVEIRQHGTAATVWGWYDFHFGSQFSHCGIDAFQLLRTPDGWKITSLTDTYETECQRRPRPEGITGHARIMPLAPNVYAVLRVNEPLGLAQNANTLVVVGDSDVVVVDAQFTREATLQTLAAIRSITPKPVGVVVNTHWHDDHLAGDQVYRDAFPGVRFVQHANTIADLEALGVPNRAGTREGAPPVAARLQRLLDVNLGADSTPVTETERAALESALRIMDRYLAEAPAFSAVPVRDTVRTRLTLRRGPTTVDIRWLGCANTRGDLVVHLPEHGIVATGDLVVWPVPFAFGSYPSSWVAALDSVAALQPRIVLPGHGPVMRDLNYLRRVRGWLAMAGGSRDSLDAAGRPFLGDEKWNLSLWRGFAGAITSRAAARCG